MEERIKEGFRKVKEDISLLGMEIDSLKLNILELKDAFTDLSNLMLKLNEKSNTPPISSLPSFGHPSSNRLEDSFILGTTANQQTSQRPNKTDILVEPSHTLPLRAQKDYFSTISMRNEGVPTDRQTDQQTNRQTESSINNPPISSEKIPYSPEKTLSDPLMARENKESLPTNSRISESFNSIDEASKILDSLDTLKREIRLKFKRLTDQEWVVFSTIYQFEEELGFVDYKSIAEKLSLTESSIREYVGKLIKKGIPVEKIKVNNKSVHLKVSQNLKKIATLPTILRLREI